MAKERSVYKCAECGHESAKWLGRCTSCEAWGTLEAQSSSVPRSTRVPATPSTPLSEIRSESHRPQSTGMSELDRVLGGGLVPGAAILLGGEPGIGKSTLLLQAAAAFSRADRPVLYVSAEESAPQLKQRADRLGLGKAPLHVVDDGSVERLLATAEELQPGWLIVDSIQAVRCEELTAIPGSVSQVRESAARCVRWAKERHIPLVLVGHVTKEGSLAGPRVLEHLVDTVIQFEGDQHHAHRLLRTLKNRFGPSGELAVFGMGDKGLIEIRSASELFLADRAIDAPGSAVLCAMEGSRPLLIEVQALVGEPMSGNPRRTSLGVDSHRLALILAVAARSLGADLIQRDVFVNVTGGVHLSEPAVDLAVAFAILSSLYGIPVAPDLVVCGELGLTGEIRAISRLDPRLREAARLGFRRAVAPFAQEPGSVEGITLIRAERLEQAWRGSLSGMNARA